MGDFFIWLSGANRRLLAECPTEQPKYFGLGAVIIVTGAMAGASLAFALVNALKISLSAAIVFAVLWGLAIIMIDRLFVSSMHRQKNPLIYVVQAIPRLVMSLVLGFVISTPFVLQIFKPEINSEIQQMQAVQRAAYFKNLPTNPVYLAVQQDQTKLNNLSALAASGGSGIDISKDPQLVSMNSQLTNAQNQLDYWRNDLSCQLYGKGTNGKTCKPGYGPLGQDDQQRIDYYSGQVQTLTAEITNRTNALEKQSGQQQTDLKGTYQAQLTAAKHTLQSAQQQLALQTANVTSGIEQNDGILEQLKALGNVTAGNTTLQEARLLLFLLFLFVDTMPVFMKLLINIMPAGTYDTILAGEEALQVRDAEEDRAQRQAARRAARQAEAAGVRARNEAYFAPLPGMTEDIIAARRRVEEHWLKRREEAMMRDVAAGSGIVGIGAPPPVAGRPGGWPAGGPGTRPPFTRTPPVLGEPARSSTAWTPVRERVSGWLASLGLSRRPRPEGWHRYPAAGAPETAGDAWAPTRPMREFKRPPALDDEPAEYLGAPTRDFDGASRDYDDGFPLDAPGAYGDGFPLDGRHRFGRSSYYEDDDPE